MRYFLLLGLFISFYPMTAQATCIGLPEPPTNNFLDMPLKGVKDFEKESLGSAIHYRSENKSFTLYRYHSDEEDVEALFNETIQPLLYVLKQKKAQILAIPEDGLILPHDSLIKKIASIDMPSDLKTFEFVGVGLHKDCALKIRYTVKNSEDIKKAYEEFVVLSSIFPLSYLEEEKFQALVKPHGVTKKSE